MSGAHIVGDAEGLVVTRTDKEKKEKQPSRDPLHRQPPWPQLYLQLTSSPWPQLPWKPWTPPSRLGRPVRAGGPGDGSLFNIVWQLRDVAGEFGMDDTATV